MKADSLRFADEPETEVRFDGSRGRRSVSGSVRTNLPDPVEAGVEYRDVRVDYTLATRLADSPAAEPFDGSDDGAPPASADGHGRGEPDGDGRGGPGE